MSQRWRNPASRAWALATFVVLLAVAVVVVVMTLAPYLGRAREASQREALRERCAANLREVWAALDAWWTERGAPPERLEDLVLQGFLANREALACPEAPPGPRTASPEGIICDYAYVRYSSHVAATGAPMIFDRSGAHGGEGRNFLFDGGVVEFRQESQVQSLFGEWASANSEFRVFLQHSGGAP